MNYSFELSVSLVATPVVYQKGGATHTARRFYTQPVAESLRLSEPAHVGVSWVTLGPCRLGLATSSSVLYLVYFITNLRKIKENQKLRVGAE